MLVLYLFLLCPRKRSFGGILFFTCPSVCLSVRLSVCLSVCPSDKKLNNFWLLSGRPLILCMSTSLDKTFQMRSWSLTSWPWPWNWKLGQKNFNLAHNSRLFQDRALILGMSIPPDYTFKMRSWLLTSWPWPWNRKLFCKTVKSETGFFLTRER